MQTESSTGEIRIVGAETEGHQVSFEILAQVLSGLQKTAYVLAAAHQVDQRKRSVIRGLGWFLSSIPLCYIEAMLANSFMVRVGAEQDLKARVRLPPFLEPHQVIAEGSPVRYLPFQYADIHRSCPFLPIACFVTIAQLTALMVECNLPLTHQICHVRWWPTWQV